MKFLPSDAKPKDLPLRTAENLWCFIHPSFSHEKQKQGPSSRINYIYIYISKIISNYQYIISFKSFSEAPKAPNILRFHMAPEATHLKATSPNRWSSSLQAWLGEGRTCLRPLVHKQPPADLRAHIHNTKIQ